MESGNLEIFASGIKYLGLLKPGIQLKTSVIPLTIGIRNPSSTDKESGIQGVQSRIQDCLGFYS